MASRPRERPGRRWCRRPWSSAPGHTHARAWGAACENRGSGGGPRPGPTPATRPASACLTQKRGSRPRASQGSSEDETRRSAGETGVACTHSLTHSFVRWFTRSGDGLRVRRGPGRGDRCAAALGALRRPAPREVRSPPSRPLLSLRAGCRPPRGLSRSRDVFPGGRGASRPPPETLAAERACALHAARAPPAALSPPVPALTAAEPQLSLQGACDRSPAATRGPPRCGRCKRAAWTELARLGVIPSMFPATAHLMPTTTPQPHVGLVPTLRRRKPGLGGRAARWGQRKGTEPGLGRSPAPARRPCRRRESPRRTHTGPRGWVRASLGTAGPGAPQSPGRNRPSLSVTPLLALPSSAPGRRPAGGLHRLPTPLLGCAARTGPHDGCSTVPSPPGCVSLPRPASDSSPSPAPTPGPSLSGRGPWGPLRVPEVPRR